MSERAWKRLHTESEKVRNFSALSKHDFIKGYLEASLTTDIPSLIFNNSLLQQALEVVNANFSIVGGPYDSLEIAFTNDKVHVIATHTAITEERSEVLHVTAFTTLTGVYYVQKKTHAALHYVHSLPNWASFLAISMAACVGVLTLADLQTGTRPSRAGIQDKITALTASILLFSSPLTTQRSAARLVLATWFSGMLLLAVSLQSLLIASVTSGMVGKQTTHSKNFTQSLIPGSWFLSASRRYISTNCLKQLDGVISISASLTGWQRLLNESKK
ncbi:hypothetical protein HPB48_020408 [Haemaphysalis longicornis]|uniref:Uncharacterized protein n=1 Tax=Haemaphysalis longicornis TaxID=44386 RepID=A0A9J6GH99_HAELO|nr:hypothetical protein HPB48_020408 [Haemaphysalis longicornis]